MFKKNIRLIFLISLSVFLTACGGGGGGTPAGTGTTKTSQVKLPNCSSAAIGTADYTGCWLSEACATPANASPTRELTVIHETVANPTKTGDLKEGDIDAYILAYNNSQCTGKPTSVVHINTAIKGGLTQKYIQRADLVCNGLSCETLDITEKNIAITFSGSTTLRVTNGVRLCMPKNGYDFNSQGLGQGGLEVGSPLGQPDTNLNFATCQTRYTN